MKCAYCGTEIDKCETIEKDVVVSQESFFNDAVIEKRAYCNLCHEIYGTDKLIKDFRKREALGGAEIAYRISQTLITCTHFILRAIKRLEHRIDELENK